MSAIPKPSPVVPKPRLSDRNAARFLRLPAAKQMRFLHDQKYPKDSPQTFKQPFYAPAIFGIREVVKRGFPGLIDARAKLERVSQESRRNNLMRVLDSFVTSQHARAHDKACTSLEGAKGKGPSAAAKRLKSLVPGAGVEPA